MSSDAFADFTHDLLRYGRNVHAILPAAEAAPGDARLNAYAAATELFAMTAEARARAAPFLARAAAAANDPDDRLLVDAVAAWAAGDLAQAIALHRRRLARAPDDLAAAKLVQLHQLDRGDFDGMLATGEQALASRPDNHFLLGQRAFALEETGASAEAAAIAARAVALAGAAGEDDPWSLHALAHVHHRRDDLEAVIAMIDAHADLWRRSNAFMSAHAWWHAAVCHLDLGRPAAALALYDAELAKTCPRCVQSLVARVSLLARLGMHGVDAGARWTLLGEALAGRVDDHVNGFLDLHFVLGLALAGRTAEAARLAAGLTDPAAIEAARGLIAYAAGRMAEATDALARAAPALPALGGSHEQRDLWRLVEEDAATAAGGTAAAAHRSMQRPRIGAAMSAENVAVFGLRPLAALTPALSRAAAAKGSRGR